MKKLYMGTFLTSRQMRESQMHKAETHCVLSNLLKSKDKEIVLDNSILTYDVS